MVGRFVAPSVGGLLIVGNDFHWVYLGAGVAGVLALAAALRLAGRRPRPPRAAGARRRSLAEGWGRMRGSCAWS